MRWPFRRRGAQPASGSAVPAAGPQPAATAPRPVRDWAALPPIPVAVTRSAPLVMGPAPVLPPLPGRRAVTAAPIAPPAGRVDGISTVLPPRPAVSDVDHTVGIQAAPVVHRPARPLPPQVPTLTEAVDEYVGQAREPAVPYRAPAWLRAVPDWLQPGNAPAFDPLAALGVPVSPPSDSPGPFSPPTFIPSTVEPERPAPAPLPPPVQEVSGSRGVEPPPTVLKRRRPNLAESRRLGLGAPVSRPAGEPFVLPPNELVLPPTAAEPEPPAPEPADMHDPGPVVVDEPVVVVEEEPPPPDQPPPPSPAPPVTPKPPPSPSGGAEPPQRVVKPTYRAPRATRSAAAKPVQRAVVVERVPPSLIDAVRTTQGADVSEVPIYRGPRVGEAARARGARAFASGGAVFLPDEAGPADSPSARGLVAHELVHAVQQRTLGPVLPSPASPQGRALEEEAQAAERYYAGEAGAPEPAPLIHPPTPAAPLTRTEVSEVDMSAPAQLSTQAPSAPTPAPATTTTTTTTATGPLHTPFDEPTRQAVDQIAEGSAKRVVAEWTNPALTGQGRSGNSPSRSARSGNATLATAMAMAGATFDRDAARYQLEQERLEEINEERLENGEPPVMGLDETEMERIERRLDRMEATHGGGSGTAQQEQVPLPEKNSAGRWMMGLTGRNPNAAGYGFSGFSAEAGTAQSWFASDSGETIRTRSATETLDMIGFGNEDARNQFDTDSWFEGNGDNSTPTEESNAPGSPAQMRAQAEKAAHGRSNTEEHDINLDRLDLDELTARLYDRLRSRLRLELLVDRERAGRLTDFR